MTVTYQHSPTSDTPTTPKHSFSHATQARWAWTSQQLTHSQQVPTFRYLGPSGGDINAENVVLAEGG
jgi:hypothetical protein